MKRLLGLILLIGTLSIFLVYLGFLASESNIDIVGGLIYHAQQVLALTALLIAAYHMKEPVIWLLRGDQK